MIRKIVADSSADIYAMEGVEFAFAPLRIMAGEHTWTDEPGVSQDDMLDTLAGWRGKSSSSCPGPGDWIDAFGNADEVFAVPISCNMSGSYNSACIAARDYMDQHPGRRVHVVDTLLASAPMTLLCEKLRDFIQAGDDFDTIVKKITEEQKKTRLLFCLQSVRSLANNGRLPHVVATMVGMLNIRMIARASERGEAEMLDKARGDKKAQASLVNWLTKLNYDGGRLIISHVRNVPFCEGLADAIRQAFPTADIVIQPAHLLCSFYAEDGGLLMGFQTK